MEQQSKYYTPDISELYVGYECEHTTCKGAFNINLEDDVVKDKLTVDDLRRYLRYCGIHGDDIKDYIRTRYLDQSDIESLGWEFDKSRGIPLEYHYTKEVNLKKYKLTKLSTKIHIGVLQQGNTLYEGECKSINELRKIMGWLNIK
jgi:hypothetical protein